MGLYLNSRYEMFKSQNQENGFFDVTFEVEGKLIYAHKFMLASVSEVLERMVSNTWNNAETIKIEAYSFNDFFEFLTFVYSEKCKIDDENVFSMVDISEFYQVNELQIKCDKFLSQKEYTEENILLYLKALSNYSLPLFEKTSFKAIKEKGINLIESKGFMLSKETVMKIVNFEYRVVSEEKLFEKICEWAENRTKKKLSESNEEIYNLNDSIKFELAGILPFICFKKMKLDFLIDFVVKKGFLFSFEELSEILNVVKANETPVKVKITNVNGKSIICMLPYNSEIVEIIKSLKGRPCSYAYPPYFAFWCVRPIKIPSVPSQIKKRDGVDWYLYCVNALIGVVHHSHNITSDLYFIAEMTAESSGFEITQNCKIEIV
uniref:BTB domain-containing protein n=1 Tax=Panagrolaimus davidi TaxID=227884 RepID=A0A914Q601_9BILA